jgi:tetratricopeptide (TPR) repeat protein
LEAQYQTARIAPLKRAKPAYDKYDQAQAALQKKDYSGAKALTNDAVKLMPNEGVFHQLLGDIALAEKREQEAVPHYQKAMQLNPGYFGSWLGAGVAQYRLKNRAQSEQFLKRSMELLPTAPAALYLGNMARDSGDVEGALKLYQTASSSQSSLGQEAAREAVQIDLPRNPGNYVATAVRAGSDGRPVLVLQNRAPVALASIQVTPVQVNSQGQVVQQGRAIMVAGPVAAGQQVSVDPGIAALTPEQLAGLRARVDSARVAQ